MLKLNWKLSLKGLDLPEDSSELDKSGTDSKAGLEGGDRVEDAVAVKSVID